MDRYCRTSAETGVIGDEGLPEDKPSGSVINSGEGDVGWTAEGTIGTSVGGTSGRSPRIKECG